MKISLWSRILALFVLIVVTTQVHAQIIPRPLLPKERYPYGEKVFTSFIEDSYQQSAGSDKLPDFYQFYSDRVHEVAERTRIPELSSQSLDSYLKSEGHRLATIKTLPERLEAEIDLSDAVFRIVKKSITRFSLDRGFEFASVVKTGERQCLLQSVLVAGMLQKAGLPAGVVMVWRGDTGEVSNLGHCVAIMRHVDGTDRIIDVSTHNIPDLMHKGLFIGNPESTGYLFAEPVYDASTHRIREYLPIKGGKTIPARKIRPLSVAFLRSQFDFYRGERAPGKLIWKEPTSEALAKSAVYLLHSLKMCPQNPLATYYLGRVTAKMGQLATAQQYFVAAQRLYHRQGWVPDTATEVFAIERGQQTVAQKPISTPPAH